MFRRDRPDIVEDWYRKLDHLAGELLARTPAGANLIFVSDHGFASFDHKVHINRWLLDQGYLAADEPDSGAFRSIDWDRSRAYALGLNSLYANLAGREGRGQVEAGSYEPFIRQLRAALLNWKEGGRPVFASVLTREQAFQGDLAAHGPDLVLGYAPGFRASQESGLGGWGQQALAPNRDHWGADHCIDAGSVNGVIFARKGLEDLAAPSFRDFPSLALGAPFQTKGASGEPPAADEEEDAVEERLKGLGYL
jgi:predicted AlkP superfamily phosphohydrolase/phosphomutase